MTRENSTQEQIKNIKLEAEHIKKEYAYVDDMPLD